MNAAEAALTEYLGEEERALYEITRYVNDVNREYAEVLMERDGSGALSTAYVYGNERISVRSTKKESGYYLYDGRGSVTGIVSIMGERLESYSYDPAGNVTRATSTNRYQKTFYGYNGESYDPKTGSVYLRARYYNTRTGSFQTKDTYLGSLMDPLSQNRYAYTQGNPVNYQDPSGHQTTNNTAASLYNSQFVQVTDSSGTTYYGGNQDWFIDSTYGNGKQEFFNWGDGGGMHTWTASEAEAYRENILVAKGCGVVFATNIAAYLYSTGDSKYANLYGYNDFSKENYIKAMTEMADYIVPDAVCGVVWQYASGLERYAESKGVSLTAHQYISTGKIEEYDSNSNVEKMKDFIREALIKDKPVAMLIVAPSVQGSYVDSSGNITGTFKTKYHWVTITGYRHDFDTDQDLVKVSTWGKIAEIDLNEYSETLFEYLMYFE